MSPQQTAQIRARLEQVAQQRKAEALLAKAQDAVLTPKGKALQAKPSLTRAKLAKAVAVLKANELPVTDTPVTNAKSSAARVAKHKAKNLEAVRAKNRATKAASRAKAKGAT